MKNTTMDRYQIVSTERGTTSRGSNYFDIEVVDTKTGAVSKCVYFGNTRPKRVTKIDVSVKGENTYAIATIQPHTSRDKKTGRFIAARR